MFVRANIIISMLKSSYLNKPILIILALLILTNLTILLDIPIFRQVFGFTFFYVVPGVIILRSIRLKNLGVTERFVLSTGLSISFLMVAGLFINTLYPLFGYDTPLSTNSLLVSFSVILLLAVLTSLRDQSSSLTELYDLKLNTREKAFLLLPSFFPLLSILGMHLMNTTDNNSMLMTLLLLMPAYAIFIAVEHSQVPERDYPLIIFFSSISLVLLLGLRSDHIIGADAHTEYYLFHQTLHNGRWQILLNSTLDSCLSISILATAYQSFVDIDLEYLFKILYPVLCSVLPLAVYIISKKYIGNFYAFLASLFFMSQNAFLATTANPRTNVGILFFALSIMILFSIRLNELEKRLIFIIFAVSCVFSHYSTTYIFFIILSLSWFCMQIIRIILSSKGMPASLINLSANPPEYKVADLGNPRNLLKSNTTIGIVMLFFVVLFLWYSQITGAAFNSGVGFIANTLTSLQDFFILESRGGGVAAVFGGGLEEKSISRKITFISSWLTIAFIAIGVSATLYKYRHRVALADDEEHLSSILSQRLDVEFFILSLICSIILAIAVALPYVFKGYGMDRAYLQMMVVLSPFFVIGGINVAESLHFRWKYLMVLAVLIPYFMCNTGTMPQIFGDKQALTLNSRGQSYYAYFVHDQDTFGARWLGGNTGERDSIYADYSGSWILISQGYIHSSYYAEKLIENKQLPEGGYIWLRYYNVIDRKLLKRDYKWNDIREYQQEFAQRSLIYSSGCSEVWR